MKYAIHIETYKLKNIIYYTYLNVWQKFQKLKGVQWYETIFH